MQTKLTYLLCIITLIGFSACNPTNQETTEAAYGNPAAEGFDAAGSDAEAIAVADEVMEAMGGRKAWDETRHICWTFLGGRDELVWDKWTGDVRIDRQNGTTLLYNINQDGGKAFVNGREITDTDSLTNFNNTAKRIWINHSYWLVMPFKLKDSGVTLKYMGEETDKSGANCDKLQLTFEEVGVTPDNRYWVWVDQNSKLVTQWAYYRNAQDTSQGFNVPFDSYQQYGDIMLSAGRGENRELSNIMVFETLPKSVYNSPEKPDLKALMQ